MPSSADLEIDAILPLQRDLAVVQPAREMHDPESVYERFRIKASQMVRDGFSANGQAHYSKCNLPQSATDFELRGRPQLSYVTSCAKEFSRRRR